MQRNTCAEAAADAATAAAARAEALRHNFISALILAAQNGYGRDVEPFLALSHETWGEEVLWDAVKDLPHGKLTSKLGAQWSGAASVTPRAAVDPYGKQRTRLMYVAQAGNVARLRWLIARGARLELKDWEGRTALWWACFAGRVDTARELLARGAAVDAARRPDGATPLLVAIRGGHWGLAQELLDRGAAMGAASTDGTTPFHLPSGEGSEVIVRALLARGAAVDAARCDGATPLHAASKGGALEVVFELLARGAPLSPAARNGRTPLDVAASSAVSRALSTAQLICGRGAPRGGACEELRRYAEGRLTAAGQLPLALVEEEARRMGEEAPPPRPPPAARRGDAEEAAMLAAAVAASLCDARAGEAAATFSRGEEELAFEDEDG